MNIIHIKLTVQNKNRPKKLCPYQLSKYFSLFDESYRQKTNSRISQPKEEDRKNTLLLLLNTISLFWAKKYHFAAVVFLFKSNQT